MKRKKVTTIAAGFAVTALALTTTAACGGTDNSAQNTENKGQQQDSSSLITNQPIPHFNWSQIRQTLIDTETIAANGTATTSFFFNQGVQDPVFSCPSLGMPVANTAQLSNPQQLVNDPNGNKSAGSKVISQMDPYGIYAPASSTGTYVICINTEGKKYVQYWEGYVSTVSAPAEWNGATHSMNVTGAPTFNVSAKPAAP